MAVFVLKATIATLESRSGKANRYVVKIGAKTIDVNGELSAVMIFFAENWGFKGWFIRINLSTVMKKRFLALCLPDRFSKAVFEIIEIMR